MVSLGLFLFDQGFRDTRVLGTDRWRVDLGIINGAGRDIFSERREVATWCSPGVSMRSAPGRPQESCLRGVVACWAPGVDGGSACVPAATYSRPERRRLDSDGSIQQNTFV